MNHLEAIEAFLGSAGIAPSRLGRDAVKDPRFVFDLRNGRTPEPATMARVQAFMEQHSCGQ